MKNCSLRLASHMRRAECQEAFFAKQRLRLGVEHPPGVLRGRRYEPGAILQQAMWLHVRNDYTLACQCCLEGLCEQRTGKKLPKHFASLWQQRAQDERRFNEGVYNQPPPCWTVRGDIARIVVHLLSICPGLLSIEQARPIRMGKSLEIIADCR